MTPILNRRSLICGAATAALTPADRNRLTSGSGETLTPEQFGAKGDGTTNDTQAFNRLARQVNARGGGIIVLRPCTYLVGLQSDAALPYAYAPVPILQLSGCRRPVTIRGNGAKLKCAPGLRYGTFDPRTGERFDHPMPFTKPGYTATPYDYMISVRDCAGGVTISDVELDGSVETLVIGGPWGDTGFQIAAVGLFLADNSGGETISNLRSHHHAQDGMMLRGPTRQATEPRSIFTRVRCEFNGRQGCSLIGGSGYTFRDCRFAETAMVQVKSAPAAGFDIEQEGNPIRDVRFLRCEFSGNTGVGLVADSGDSADVSFVACRFVGTANWAVWPHKPRFRFVESSFEGPIVNCWSDSDPARATQFVRCTFADTATLPLRGKPPEKGPIVNLAEGQNVLFDGCRFTVAHGWSLPWSLKAIYQGCTMRQTGGAPGYPRGTYRGTNTIIGPVDLYSSHIIGTVSVNGRRLAG